MVQTSDSVAVKLPGVQREQVTPTPAAPFLTGVPAFLGLTTRAPRDREGNERFGMPQKLTLWTQFQAYFGDPFPNSYLAAAINGFFANGGRLCYVVPLRDQSSFEEALQPLESLGDIDLVCVPDVMQVSDSSQRESLQLQVLEHCCQMGDRFAILDALNESVEAIAAQQQHLTQQAEQLSPDASSYGALYAPWVYTLPSVNNGSQGKAVPPCGHIAGMYAQSDRAVGVHKAPANSILEDVVNLTLSLSNTDQQALNPDSKGAGVNCIRAFPGRGIRAWGASTLSRDTNWHYLSVRRLFLTVNRWIKQNLVDVVFEPNDFQLWNRIERELTTYLESLRQQGALQGTTPQEAFYVKCDAETNPIEQRDLGAVVTEIGLAPTLPNEFIVVRLIQGETGVATL